nr:MAG TPA: hypothetical protein [Caudoviricetes sp.]
MLILFTSSFKIRAPRYILLASRKGVFSWKVFSAPS